MSLNSNKSLLIATLVAAHGAHDLLCEATAQQRVGALFVASPVQGEGRGLVQRLPQAEGREEPLAHEQDRHEHAHVVLRLGQVRGLRKPHQEQVEDENGVLRGVRDGGEEARGARDECGEAEKGAGRELGVGGFLSELLVVERRGLRREDGERIGREKAARVMCELGL